MTARLNDRLYRRFIKDEAVVMLDDARFALSGGWSRWLHMVACQVRKAISPEVVLRQRAVYTGTPEKLRSDVHRAKVPGYTLSFKHEGHGQPYALHIEPA